MYPTAENFKVFLLDHGVKQSKSLAKQFLWNPMLDTLPNEAEVIPFFTRTNRTGIVFYKNNGSYSYVSFEVAKKSKTMQSAICDLCKTQRGSGDVRLVMFSASKVQGSSQPRSQGWLCCIDLACSAHVRNLTTASLVSRSQLRETELTSELRQAPLSVNSMINRLANNVERLQSLL